MDADLGGDPTGPTLDEEGVPDLQGPDPAKAATGDPQEGEPPPSTYPASQDWGVTASEERHGEPLSVRTAREQPDLGDPDAFPAEPRSLVLVDGADEDVAGPGDLEKEAVGRGVGQSGMLVAPEDAAIHLIDDEEVSAGYVGGDGDQDYGADEDGGTFTR